MNVGGSFFKFLERKKSMHWNMLRFKCCRISKSAVTHVLFSFKKFYCRGAQTHFCIQSYFKISLWTYQPLEGKLAAFLLWHDMCDIQWIYLRVIPCQIIQYFWMLTPFSYILFIFSLFAGNVEMINPWTFQPSAISFQLLMVPKLLRFENRDRCSRVKSAILNLSFL